MEIIYLHHSGFAILANQFTIIIDFFEDSESESCGILHDKLLNKNGTMYVLSSHFHADHFNRQVLEWKEYSDNNIKITAFGSTDVGISFMIEAEGKTLFHAGDLNNWHWMDESTEEEWKRDEQKFLNELKIIKEKYDKVDIAMFPIDPRLGTEYMRGGKQFIDAIQTSTFIPMHFWNDYASANKFQEYARLRNINSPEINHRGQIFSNL